VLFVSLAIPAALVVLVLRWPRLALYALMACAIVFEIFPLTFSDSFTDDFGFFLNLNNSAGLPISASPADLTVIVALLGWLRARAGDHSLRPDGPLLKAYVLFGVALAIAEVHGLLSQGDFNVTLWELRPQIYGFATFVVASSLIRDRRHLVILASIFLAAASVKVGVGYNRYFNTLHSDLGTAEAILAHEDSYFLSMVIVALVAALIWFRRRMVVLALLVLAPFAGLVMLENHRRVGILALGAALAIITILGVRFESRIRYRIAAVALVAGLAYAGLLVAFWNAEYGVAAQLVRPVHSLFQPDERDYNSNLYRQNEDANLVATYHQSPLIGVGFGLPMQVVFPLADISQQYPFWQFIPHNTIFWIGMRMGLLGMMTFWGMLGIALLQGIRVLRDETMPLVKASVAFALAGVIAELIVGFGDLQLENYRNLIFFGCMLGVINAGHRIRETVHAKRPAWAAVPTIPGVPMGGGWKPSYTPLTPSTPAG